MEMSERLLEIRKELGLNQLDFAKSLGLKQGSYSGLETGAKTTLSNGVKELLTLQYGLNPLWVETGEGNKYLARKMSNSVEIEATYPAKPFIDAAYAECGKPGGFSLCVKRDDCELLSIPFVKDYDFSITATGDSMINRVDVRRSIQSGDIVACKIVNSRTHVRFGEVYALSTLDGFTIKKVVPSDKDGCVRCVPFNTEDNFYEFDLPVEEIFDWAFVVSVVRINKW